MRSIALLAVFLSGCAGMKPMDPEAFNRAMQGALIMQQARQPVYAPQPVQQLPQWQRCVTRQVGGQLVTDCN